MQQALSSNCSSNVENSQLNNDKLSSVDHSYTKNTYSSYNTSTKLTSLTHNIYQSFIAFIGGLHVQLNGQGDIMGNYHQFLKFVYENLFKNCILALKPKPWRTSNLFEIVYGGWTLIRECVIAKFADNKSVEYAIILTLLDTYIPLCISIYSVIFKSNKFKEFKKAMTRTWLMFRCFRRRHYDKSPLIWLSNLMFWEKNNKELYDTLKQHINITDEYPVENTHSIIRGNTNSWDSAELLSFKARSILSSKDRQHNFRSYFTPPKGYTFSRKQLKYLEVKCAQLLASKVFVPLASASPDLSHILPTKIEHKSVILPYGYHTDWPPVESRLCDMPTCPEPNADKPWSRFDGCWHSFHVACLQGSSICEICRGQIKRDITKLAKIASDAIFNPAVDSDNNDDANDEGATDISNTVHEMNDADVNNEIKKLKETISKTNPSTPLTSNSKLQFVPHASANNKKAHCKKCNHVVQGHKRPKDGPNKCPKCPNGICCSEGRKTACDCDEHSANTSVSTNINASSQGHVNTSQNKFTANRIGNINYVTLEVSQGDLSEGIGSNACTVIAIFLALKFLQNEIDCPTGDISQETVNQFITIMKAGNTIYDIINPPVWQPNLFVEDVINAVNFPFEKPEQSDSAIVADHKSLEAEIKDTLVTAPGKNALIVIVPMDKSMLLCSNDSHLILFESHKHNDKGAVIATTTRDNTKEMTEFIAEMSRSDWNTTIVGTNLIPMKMKQI